MINTKQLKLDRNKKDNIKLQSYNKILELINNKILIVSKTKETNTWFEIPIIMLGYPSYEIIDCSNFLIKKLKKNGFNVNFLNPNILLINW